MNRALKLIAVFVICSLATPAWSQLEEVVVTAQKREENLQDVPIAITALTSDSLAASGIRTISEVTQMTPSLNFSQTTTFAQPFIRGVGTDSFAPGIEASVATYVDGVYYPDMGGGLFALNNIERIEVLKGPQGTLYGRNSTGGLLNVITKTPGDETEFNASAGFGDYDILEGGLYLGGSLSDVVAADVAISYRDQGEGYYFNEATGNDIVKEEGSAIRSKWVITPTETFKLTATADYIDYTNTLAVTRQPGPGTTPALIPGTFSLEPGRYNSTQDLVGGSEQWGVSARIDWDFEAFSLVSITAYRENDMSQTLDADDSAADFAFLNAPTASENFTQEFQLISDNGSNLQWIVGAFYQDGDAGWSPLDLFVGGAQAFSVEVSSGIEALGLFGQVDYSITDATKVTVGLRYNDDTKDYRSGFAPDVKTETTWSEPTWRLALDHRFSEALMGYASISRGYKSGAYNTLETVPPVPVDPEIVDAYEIGFKSDLLEDRLQLNVAAFFNDFSDIQIRSQAEDNVTVRLQNAAKAEILGLEVEGSWLISDGLSVDFGLSWLDSEYVEFDRAPYFDPNPPTVGGNTEVFRSAAGNKLSRTPEWSGFVAASYERQIGSGTGYISGNFFMTDDIYWDPSNRVVTESYHVLNALVGWRSNRSGLGIELWSRNLTDELYENYVVPSETSDRFSYAPPRTYGIRFNYQY